MRGSLKDGIITDQPIELQNLIDKVEDPSAGAIATFTGVTRNNFKGKEVLKLEYEAYEPMACKKLQVLVCTELGLESVIMVFHGHPQHNRCRRFVTPAKPDMTSGKLQFVIELAL